MAVALFHAASLSNLRLTVFQFSRFVLKDLTVPDEVGAELDAVQVVRLTLIVEPHLLQVLAILPWQGMTISSKE